MFLSRLNHGMLVASAFGFNQSLSVAASSVNELAQAMRNTLSQSSVSKPNRISQAKRRKYKRQGRECGKLKK